MIIRETIKFGGKIMLKKFQFKKNISVFLSMLIILSCALVSSPQNAKAAGTTYYVDANIGKDTYSGTSPSQAFKTLNYAASLPALAPGDTVIIKGGTYEETNGGTVLNIKKSGSAAGGFITFRAATGETPILKASNAWNIVLVDAASYIKIEGLTVQGNGANISYATAKAEYDYVMNCINNKLAVDYDRIDYCNTNGINIEYNKNTMAIPHHIEVRNNTVRDCPGAGICSKWADYLTIEDNKSFGNCKDMIYGGSGISLLCQVDVDSNTGYKNFIRRNLVYDNETLIPWAYNGDGTQISDGDGIIMDTFWGQGSLRVMEGSASDGSKDVKKPDYAAKTLVENNIAYENGGAGIYCCGAVNTDFVNNTAYNNDRSPALNYGELRAGWGKNIRFINNIGYARTGENNINTINNYGNVTFDYNIAYGGVNSTFTGSNNLYSDPAFVDLAAKNFKLLPGSPAIDSGTTTQAPANDFNTTARPQGSGIDRGAYEMKNLLNNPSLEAGNLGAWTRSGLTLGNVENTAGNAKSGSWYFSMYDAAKVYNSTVSQNITNCSAGTYTATVWTCGSNAATFEVKRGTTVLKTVSIPVNTGAYKPYVLTGINVNAGDTITVSASVSTAAAGSYRRFDDFEFYKN